MARFSVGTEVFLLRESDQKKFGGPGPHLVIGVRDIPPAECTCRREVHAHWRDIVRHPDCSQKVLVLIQPSPGQVSYEREFKDWELEPAPPPDPRKQGKFTLTKRAKRLMDAFRSGRGLRP